MTTSTIRPGQLAEERPGVWRLTAPNGGPMTGPGTNTWLLGTHRDVILDAGPDVPEHVAAIRAAVGDSRRLRLLATHTHRDHSPAIARLAERSQTEVIGLPAPAGDSQDATFVPDRIPADGERLCFGAIELIAVHTPGHASNHVCYLQPSSGVLFTGDHVMQGSTVVIPPPDGDMAAYIDSLHKIAALGASAIAPGHGRLITTPARTIRRLIRHRGQREARVLAALRAQGEATTDELLPTVYRDVPVARHPVARFSLEAHLIKLADEGRVARDGARWRTA